MGEMGSLIEISNLVFVAGSIAEKIGGHNPAVQTWKSCYNGSIHRKM